MIRDGFACPKVLGKNLSDIKLVAAYIYTHTCYRYIIYILYSCIHTYIYDLLHPGFTAAPPALTYAYTLTLTTCRFCARMSSLVAELRRRTPSTSWLVIGNPNRRALGEGFRTEYVRIKTLSWERWFFMVLLLQNIVAAKEMIAACAMAEWGSSNIKHDSSRMIEASPRDRTWNHFMWSSPVEIVANQQQHT